MCFGGSKPPAVEAPPAAAPTPTPTPTQTGAVTSATDRAKKLASYQYGLASTIKTGAQGISGRGPELRAPSVTGVNTTGQGSVVTV